MVKNQQNKPLLSKNNRQIYLYKMENNKFCGNWSKKFITIKENKTMVIFTKVNFIECFYGENT